MSIELTPELAPEFAVTVRGYDRAQVDEYIDWLREWLSNATVRMESAEAESGQLREQLRRLQQRVDELEVETSDQPPRTIGALGDRMTRILELGRGGGGDGSRRCRGRGRAGDGARPEPRPRPLARATQERQAELDSRLANANERAAADPRTPRPGRPRPTALPDAREAETRAKATETDADARARELVESAQQERARILEQLTTEKAALDAHIEGLVAQRAEVLAGLSKLHDSLATTIVDAAGRRPRPTARSAAGPMPISPSPDACGGHPRPGDDQTRCHRRQRVHDAVGAAGRQIRAGLRGGRPPDRRIPEVAGDDAAAADAESPAEGARPDGAVRPRGGRGRERPPPLPPSFRRAGSQPDGSQRAGG